MFLQTCQPYFTYLESTARNSNPFRPPLSTYIRAQVRNWFILHILRHKLQESIYLLYLYPITAFTVFSATVFSSGTAGVAVRLLQFLLTGGIRSTEVQTNYKSQTKLRQIYKGFRINGSLISTKGRPDFSISRAPHWDISITIIILLRCRFLLCIFFYSISHYYIGQCQIDNMKLSIFRYCCPTPFLASASTGLYKRMRWNVERQIEGEGEGQTYDSAEL